MEAETRGYDAVKTRPPPITSGIGLLDRMCVTTSAETNMGNIGAKVFWILQI